MVSDQVSKSLILNMKKLLILSILFLLFSTTTTFATSGACSYHGGANCSVKSSSGNAICNDGWESSVPYGSMVECIASNQCSRPTTTQCPEAGLQSQLIQSGASRYTPELAQGQLQVCQNQNQQYQVELRAYNNCLNTYRSPQVIQVRNTQPTISSSPTCPQGYMLIKSECKSNAQIEAEIKSIAQQVKNQSPEEAQKSKEEICKNNIEMSKNDPVGFAEYKKNLEILGIPVTDCSNKKSGVVVKKPLSEIINENASTPFQNPSQESVKQGFFHRIWSWIKFW